MIRIGSPAAILLSAGLLAAGLIGLVVYEGTARARGREVLLAMEAVDTRDLLTGDSAELSLRERLPAGQGCPQAPDTPGEPGWVALRRVGDRHQVSGFAVRRDRAAALGEILVRGRAWCRGGAWTPLESSGGAGPVVRMEIGVTRFHADERQARQLARLTRGSPADEVPRTLAVVSVGSDGRARLKGLIVEGRRLDLDWF